MIRPSTPPQYKRYFLRIYRVLDEDILELEFEMECDGLLWAHRFREMAMFNPPYRRFAEVVEL